METNTDVIVLAEPLGLDERRDILAKTQLQGGGAKKISGGIFSLGGWLEPLITPWLMA